MELGYLVQVVFRGLVTVSSGVQRPVVNSFVYRSQKTPPQQIDKALYLNAVFGAVWDDFVALLHSSYISQPAIVIYPNTPGDTPTTLTATANGGQGGSRLPLNSAIYLQGITGARGRPYVACKRLAPIAGSDVAGDELTPAAFAAWQGAVAGYAFVFAVPGTVGGNDVITPVCWSRTLSANDLTVPPAIGADILHVRLDKTISVWRHRKERVVR